MTELSKTNEYTVAVEDMSCQHCVASVSEAARTVEGVTSVNVDLESGMVSLTGGKPHEVINAITKAGYAAHPQAVIPDTCTLDENSSIVDTPPFPAGSDQVDLSNSYEISISDMTCSSCVASVEKAIFSVKGVSYATVNLVQQSARVCGGQVQEVVNAIIDQGYNASFSQNTSNEAFLKIQFKGTQPDKEKLIEVLNPLDENMKIFWSSPTLKLETSVHPADILLILGGAGFDVRIIEDFVDPAVTQANKTREDIRRSWLRALLAGSVGFSLMFAHMAGFLPDLNSTQTIMGITAQGSWAIIAMICLMVMYFSGRSYYVTAFKQARHFSANMDTLVALGTGAAWIASVIVIINPDIIPGKSNLYLDASVLILAFLQFGHALESRAKTVTGEAIGVLIKLAPKTARIQRKNDEVMLPLSLLRVGDVVKVKPAEPVPADGMVIEGNSLVDESMLTGEPLAIKKKAGDKVTAGTRNKNGMLVVEVSSLTENSTLSHIIEMVKQAQSAKPAIARMVDKVAAVFVPVVILIALLTFIMWAQFGPEPVMAYAFTTAIAVLVIACPCALGLATPIAVMMGTARAAQLNILFRNTDGLQSAASLTHLVVDKTGTLTKGIPRVIDFINTGHMDKKALLSIVASLENNSEHPLAEAMLDYANESGVSPQAVTHFRAVTGEGVQAEIDHETWYLGNARFMAEKMPELDENIISRGAEAATSGGTPVWLANKDNVQALLVINDPVREDSKEAVLRLQKQHIKVVMCTGDNQHAASALADALGIDEMYSEVTPEEKLSVVKKLQSQGFNVGMVGDGVNDAPALAQADTSFAIGSGTDVAISNADITLAGDSLLHVNTAIAISSATLKNIKQNLAGAFIYNVIGIPLAAGLFFPFTGWLLQPMFASAAMALSSVTVVSNANRLRFFKP